MQILEFGTVIVGSGLAGLTAAFHSSKHGSVAIVTKSQLDTSNSYYAQGGIAAAISEDDSPEQHLHDTLVAGRGLCDYDAVEVLVTEGRDRVLELIEMGMPFDKKNGKFILGLEGGHSKRRILHAGGDVTGKELTSFMLNKVKEIQAIKSFEYVAALKLLQKNGCIVGVQCYDFATGKNIIFKAKAVILATGGLSRLYIRSTNPYTATGEGIAMAYEAGAKIADMEFIQFHPSALYIPGQEAYLISEAVRGEGAWLLDENGRRFMKEAHPLAELAPRDVVAYNIFKKIQTSEANNIYLSLKHLDSDKIKKRFHHIYEQLKTLGLDLTSDLIPVSPAAHYMVGGIRTNLNGETNISGLFICGEVASTGVMGANRLASNSLLECLVFGKRAGDKAAKTETPEYSLKNIDPVYVNSSNETKFLEIHSELAIIMSENMGIIRSEEGIKKVLRRLNELDMEYGGSQNEHNNIRIRNTVTVCKLIAMAALAREESRGSHIRDDYQQESIYFKAHSIQQKNQKIKFEPVKK
ncbi:MAG: L-aspartate oxidase [Bacteroidales bacterium]|jgi:L-aspartate oxidase|nr:L-aspartate oxidase [Bacteroidales bacterium]